eukprot:scaffold26183_cov101-Isochrysis_galbana.AAC.2
MDARLCDPALHDEKVRVVDVESNRVEQVLHALQLRVLPVDQVLVTAADGHLGVNRKQRRAAWGGARARGGGKGQRSAASGVAGPRACTATAASPDPAGARVVVAVGRELSVRVVEDERHARLGHARLALLVDELVQVARAHLHRVRARVGSAALHGPARTSARLGSAGTAIRPLRTRPAARSHTRAATPPRTAASWAPVTGWRCQGQSRSSQGRWTCQSR